MSMRYKLDAFGKVIEGESVVKLAFDGDLKVLASEEAATIVLAFSLRADGRAEVRSILPVEGLRLVSITQRGRKSDCDTVLLSEGAGPVLLPELPRTDCHAFITCSDEGPKITWTRKRQDLEMSSTVVLSRKIV